MSLLFATTVVVPWLARSGLGLSSPSSAVQHSLSLCVISLANSRQGFLPTFYGPWKKSYVWLSQDLINMLVLMGYKLSSLINTVAQMVHHATANFAHHFGGSGQSRAFRCTASVFSRVKEMNCAFSAWVYGRSKSVSRCILHFLSPNVVTHRTTSRCIAQMQSPPEVSGERCRLMM